MMGILAHQIQVKMIIIADDEPLVRMVVADALTDAGFEVVEAGTAEEAIALLEAHAGSVDGLFTDVQMSGSMNGVALAHHTCRSWPSIPVLVASGHPLPEDAALPENSRSSITPPSTSKSSPCRRCSFSPVP